MEPKTRCLAPYIESIHYGDSRTPFSKQIFDYGITHRSPSLKFGCINRILVYPGSFNPPHLAHVEILRNGFTKSGRDMNIIAAIILPLDDEYCKRKLGGQKRPLIFTKAERARLWNGYGLSDWYWTYDRSESEWYNFQKRLTDNISKDGLNISWVALCGPEYVNLDGIPSVPVFGCKDIMVSDAGRPADFTTRGVDRLRTLKGCEAWEEVLLDFKALQRHAREDTSWVYSGIFMINPIYGERMIREGKLDHHMVQHKTK